MRSMTGSGQGTSCRDGLEAVVEIRSVNHRYLDVACRVPRGYGFLEEPLRKSMALHAKRGHLEVMVQVNRVGGDAPLTVQLPVARSLYQGAKQLACELGLPDDVTVAQLLQMEGVVLAGSDEADRLLVTEVVTEAVNRAGEALILSREMEGDRLCQDVAGMLRTVEEIQGAIALQAPQVVEAYKARLESRLAAWRVEVADPMRIAQEVALMADRYAIDEELARLSSHVRQMDCYLSSSGEVGKKMDFLIQEMNREANTMGSKSPDSTIAQLVVDLKAVIEKIREQVQNIE